MIKYLIRCTYIYFPYKQLERTDLYSLIPKTLSQKNYVF